MHYEICCKPPASAICICEIMAFAEVRNHTEQHKCKWKAYVCCVRMLDGSSGLVWVFVCAEFPLGFLNLFPRCSCLPLQGRYVLAFVSVEIGSY